MGLRVYLYGPIVTSFLVGVIGATETPAVKPEYNKAPVHENKSDRERTPTNDEFQYSWQADWNKTTQVTGKKEQKQRRNNKKKYCARNQGQHLLQSRR